MNKKKIDKKKLVKTLQIMGMLSLVPMGILMILTLDGNEPSDTFLFCCFFPVLLILCIPSFERSYRIWDLAKSRKEEKVVNLNLRLVLYPIVACAIIIVIVLLPFSYSNTISDLPNLISKDYEQINESTLELFKKEYGPRTPTTIFIVTDTGTQLQMLGNSFEPINTDEKYTFYYLPNTGWVMDIVDEDGLSLLKKR